MAYRTPTETMMSVLEEFAECEAKECIIIWTDEAGDIAWSSSSDSLIQRLGMLEYVVVLTKQRIKQQLDKE